MSANLQLAAMVQRLGERLQTGQGATDRQVQLLQTSPACLMLTDCASHHRTAARVWQGTITIWENVGGKRGKQLFLLSGIPLTPGPLLVVVKVASSLTGQPDKYWPPTLADSIETIAASCKFWPPPCDV